MTAKAKAIQVLVAASISAVAYTVYTNSSGKEKKTETAQVKPTDASSVEKKNKNANQQSIEYAQPAVPGYSNPEEYVR